MAVVSSATTEGPGEQRPASACLESAVQVRGVGKRFGRVWVIRGLSFTVERGTIFGLFGPSGAGKTTTIRLVLGLMSPDEGTIRVLGTPPDAFTDRIRSRVGYMPQLFVLYPELSVGENLDLVASLYGIDWWRRRRPIRSVLELVELSEHRRKPARELSGGMRRRLALAAALLHDPDLIVVDEPTAGIDPILRAKLWDHFRALRADGRTILVTSQYVTEAEYCDRIAMLGHGRLVATGTPAELRRHAMGGDIVDVVADGLDRPALATVAALPGVRKARQVSYDQIRLTVDQANVAIPGILSALSAAGVGVRQVQERRPNFDEVFMRVMEQTADAPAD